MQSMQFEHMDVHVIMCLILTYFDCWWGPLQQVTWSRMAFNDTQWSQRGTYQQSKIALKSILHLLAFFIEYDATCFFLPFRTTDNIGIQEPCTYYKSRCYVLKEASKMILSTRYVLFRKLYNAILWSPWQSMHGLQGLWHLHLATVHIMH